MLYSLDTKNYITDIPYEHEYNVWRSRLRDGEFQAIVDELNSKIDSGEIHTSSWMPGNDWTGTVFQPIYEKACQYDISASGKCFGLILWVVMMEHEDVWSFGRYEKNGIPIEGMTYFKLNNPPSRKP